MKKLVFASNNPHKLEEIRAILSGQVEVISLAELGCHDDIAETADSLEGNALIKAGFLAEAAFSNRNEKSEARPLGPAMVAPLWQASHDLFWI